MYFTLDEIKKALREDHWSELKDNPNDWDWLAEFADGLVPVYYNEIISDWQEMPSEYEDSGAELCGADAGIFARMTADLWNYYQEQTRTAYEQVKGELENADD